MPKVKYIGKGSFVQGVPARDMEANEWDAIPKERQEAALKTGTHKLAYSGSIKSKSKVEESDNGE